MINTVRRLRFELGLNQSELAQALGVSQPFVSLVENGQCKLPTDKAAILREILAERRNDTGQG